MSKKDMKRLNREASKNRKGHKLSKQAIFNLSQERRRSLY